ncbi:GerAB/ArcD/ProY family transporter [Paenibacillus cellulositrophicus]|uniref:GerAB/ArcD/ProY family transporter n=1 Tax=Paenibacillus cellulositrophicus TaxID=562959 RepID=UPI003F81D26B
MNKVTNRQFRMLGITYILNTTLIHVPSELANYAKQHAYLSFFPAGIVVALMFLLLSKSAKRFPGKDLFQSLNGRYKVIGRVITILYLIFFFIILARDIRMVADFTNVVLLPLTPIFIISIAITATVIYIARGGVQTVMGIADLYGPVMTTVVLIIPFIVAKDFDFSYIKPYFYVDWAGVGKGSWVVFSYLGQILALPFIFSSKDYRIRDGMYALILSTGLLLLIVIMIALLVGVPIAESLMYPSYEMSRQIKITDFLDRFDMLLVGLWFPAVLLNIATSLFIICYGLKTMIPQISGKMMTSPIGLFAVVTAFWIYPNSIEVFRFDREWTVVALVFVIVLPIFIFLFHRPHRKPRMQEPREDAT